MRIGELAKAAETQVEIAGLTKTYLDRYMPGMRQRGLSAGCVWP